MKKDEIRRQVRARKALLSDEEKHDKAARVWEALEHTAAFKMARNILMYHSLPDELATHGFLDRWHSRKSLFLPRVNGVNLEILPYVPGALADGSFDIAEPQGHDLANISDMDLVIVPAVAYDRAGNRVGRGKGYYDRLLSSCSATKIGIGYHFQLVEEIDSEPHDVGVDMVITERSSIIVKVKRR